LFQTQQSPFSAATSETTHAVSTETFITEKMSKSQLSFLLPKTPKMTHAAPTETTVPEIVVNAMPPFLYYSIRNDTCGINRKK